ncbi:MAG: cupin domain-containing protein [Saprospiraceae bacterium]|nr:cupin domain-containing protein [Saprospiraceae bacterium]
MSNKGQILTNPTNGDTYEFLETSEKTHGSKLVMKATICSRGLLVPIHYQVYQDESFKVISGQLTIISNDQHMSVGVGEKIVLPKNIPHNHFNDQPEPLIYLHTVTPAPDFEHLIETLTGLAADGKSKNGQYGLLQQLASLKYPNSKSYVTDTPEWVQNILMNTVAPIARLFGYRAVYRKYSGIEK